MNETIEERQAQEKQQLLDALKEMPVTQLACKKAGISRATYYRWRQEDRVFKRASMDALTEGVEFINDMSETQLVTLIKEKKMPAIAMWLKHRHPSYGAKVKLYPSLATNEDLTPEEEQIMLKALTMASSGRRISTKANGKSRSRTR